MSESMDYRSFALLSALLLLFFLLCVVPPTKAQSNCKIGSSSVSRASENAPLVVSGQYIDLTGPAICDGRITGVFYCSDDPHDILLGSREFAVRIWRFLAGSTSSLRFVSEYNFTMKSEIISEGNLNGSCFTESVDDDEGGEVHFKQGDLVGFLFPPDAQLHLGKSDSVMTEEVLYRDIRSEEEYNEVLDLTDLEIASGIQFNIHVQVSAATPPTSVLPRQFEPVLQSDPLDHSSGDSPVEIETFILFNNEIKSMENLPSSGKAEQALNSMSSQLQVSTSSHVTTLSMFSSKIEMTTTIISDHRAIVHTTIDLTLSSILDIPASMPEVITMITKFNSGSKSLIDTTGSDFQSSPLRTLEDEHHTSENRLGRTQSLPILRSATVNSKDIFYTSVSATSAYFNSASIPLELTVSPISTLHIISNTISAISEIIATTSLNRVTASEIAEVRSIIVTTSSAIAITRSVENDMSFISSTSIPVATISPSLLPSHTSNKISSALLSTRSTLLQTSQEFGTGTEKSDAISSRVGLATTTASMKPHVEASLKLQRSGTTELISPSMTISSPSLSATAPPPNIKSLSPSSTIITSPQSAVSSTAQASLDLHYPHSAPSSISISSSFPAPKSDTVMPNAPAQSPSGHVTTPPAAVSPDITAMPPTSIGNTLTSSSALFTASTVSTPQTPEPSSSSSLGNSASSISPTLIPDSVSSTPSRFIKTPNNTTQPTITPPVTLPGPDLSHGTVTWMTVVIFLFAVISGSVMFIGIYIARACNANKSNKPSPAPSHGIIAIDNPSYSVKTSDEDSSSNHPILVDLSADDIPDPANECTGGTAMDSPLMDVSRTPCLGNTSTPSKSSPSKEKSCGNTRHSMPTDTVRQPSMSELVAAAAAHQHGRDGERALNSSLSTRTHDYEELYDNISTEGFSRKRQSHQYEEPEPHPPYIAQEYELPVSNRWNRLSLPSLEEDIQVPQEVLDRRNSSTSDDLVSINSGIVSYEADSGMPSKMIQHYAEISLYPVNWHQLPQRTRPTMCHKVHSFSHSRASNTHRHEYDEPSTSARRILCSLPTPSPRKSSASDYEVPVPTKPVQRTQSSKPEQLSMAVQRRNRLTLIREAEGLLWSPTQTDHTSPWVQSHCGNSSLGLFDCDGSITDLRSSGTFSTSTFKLNPLLQNEVSPLPSSAMDGAYLTPSSDEQQLGCVINKLSVPTIPYSSLENSWSMNEPEQRAVWKKDANVCSSPVGTRIDVTIKQANSTEPDSCSRTEILQEVAMTAQFRHPNIVKLYGVVNDGRHTILVGEYFPRGDLRKVLVQMGRNVIPSDAPQLLLSYSQQAALGMQYLASKGFVHRDLSARNVYVSENEVCKVGGFDKSRDLANVSDYIAKGGKMQVRWMAPEAIHHCQYSTASDVWSYGCLLYEIWSLGRMPFRDDSNAEVIDKVDSGYRLPPPPGCPLVIYNLMMECWHPNPFSRPCFKDILSTLLQDEDKLLKIPIKDASTHSSAILLGASLKAGTYMYPDLQRKYARKVLHRQRNAKSVSFKSHDYDHIEDEKIMLAFPTSSADLAAEPKQKPKKQRFEFEESYDSADSVSSRVRPPSTYSEPVVVSKFSQSLPTKAWKNSDYEDVLDL